MSSVVLSYEEEAKLIEEISLGGKLVYVTNYKGLKIPLFLVHCVGLDKIASEAEYTMAYDMALSSGLMTVEQLTEVFMERGIFTREEEEGIDKIRGQIAAQELYLSKISQLPSRRLKTQENIKRYKDKLLKLVQSRENHLYPSAERKAQMEKLLFMTWKGTLDPYTSERFWELKEDFKNEKDSILRDNVVTQYTIFSFGLDVSTIRYLARSNLWRVRYLTATKTGADLFGRSIDKYTVDQLALAYWSHFYQAIFDMLTDERPQDSVIEDDLALDAFMKNYMEERNREGQANFHKNNRGKLTAWNHQETLVMRSNESYGDMEYSKTPASVIKEKGSTLKVDKSTRGPGVIRRKK